MSPMSNSTARKAQDERDTAAAPAAGPSEDDTEALVALIEHAMTYSKSASHLATAVWHSDWLAARERAAEERGAREAGERRDPLTMDGDPTCVCGTEESRHPSDHGFVDAAHYFGQTDEGGA